MSNNLFKRFRKEFKIKEDNFYDEVADLLSICEADGFRPGLELLRVRRNNILN